MSTSIHGLARHRGQLMKERSPRPLTSTPSFVGSSRVLGILQTMNTTCLPSMPSSPCSTVCSRCVVTMFVLFRSPTSELATSPLPSSEGCRPPNIGVNRFREGSWVGGRETQGEIHGVGTRKVREEASHNRFASLYLPSLLPTNIENMLGHAPPSEASHAHHNTAC